MSAEPVIACAAVYLIAVYGLYPALVRLRALLLRSRPGGQSLPLTFDAAVVLVENGAHDRVKARLQNLLASDFGTRPGEETLQIVLVCRSGDGAARRAREIRDDRLKVVETPSTTPHGECLNRGVAASGTADLVVFTTMDATFAADTVRQLAGPFRDPRVGAVCGVVRLQNPPGQTAAAAATFLRAGEWLRAYEATADSAVGGLPSLFAMRRGLVPEFLPNDELESLLGPMHAAARGRRVVLAAGAVAYEYPPGAGSEFIRIRRRTAALVETLVRTPSRILGNRLAPLTIFHEILRLLTPAAFLVLLTAAGFAARDSGPWTWTFAVALAAVLIALAGAAGLWRRPWFLIDLLSRTAIRSGAVLAGLLDAPGRLLRGARSTRPATSRSTKHVKKQGAASAEPAASDSVQTQRAALDPPENGGAAAPTSADQPPVSNPG